MSEITIELDQETAELLDAIARTSSDPGAIVEAGDLKPEEIERFLIANDMQDDEDIRQLLQASRLRFNDTSQDDFSNKPKYLASAATVGHDVKRVEHYGFVGAADYKSKKTFTSSSLYLLIGGFIGATLGFILQIHNRKEKNNKLKNQESVKELANEKIRLEEKSMAATRIETIDKSIKKHPRDKKLIL